MDVSQIVTPIEIVKAFVLSHAVVAERVGDRVWLNVTEPAKGWKPECGDGLIITTRSGDIHPDVPIWRLSYYFRAYAMSPLKAERLFTLITDEIHGCANVPVYIDEQKVGWLVLCELSMMPVPDRTQKVGWPYVMGAFDLTMTRG